MVGGLSSSRQKQHVTYSTVHVHFITSRRPGVIGAILVVDRDPCVGCLHLLASLWGRVDVDVDAGPFLILPIAVIECRCMVHFEGTPPPRDR